MSLARWRLSPRLLTIKLANTRMADGAHVIQQRFTELETRIAEIRAQGTIERGPQEALLTDLILKVDNCSQECGQLQGTTAEACSDLLEKLKVISSKLSQLRGLLETMQKSVNEVLRPSSFEPVAQLTGNINNLLSNLESHSATHNARRFWPMTLIWSMVGGAGLWILFHATSICQQLFGVATELNVSCDRIVGWGLFLLGLTAVIGRIYACFKPNSSASPVPNPGFDFWVINNIVFFAASIVLTLWIECVSIADWLWSAPGGDNGGTAFLTVVVGIIIFIIAAIVFICNLRDNT